MPTAGFALGKSPSSFAILMSHGCPFRAERAVLSAVGAGKSREGEE